VDCFEICPIPFISSALDGVRLLESSFFWKINFKKVNYFLMFGSVMENKLENIFQYLVISWKMSSKITY
jgi:hypothetical protein